MTLKNQIRKLQTFKDTASEELSRLNLNITNVLNILRNTLVLEDSANKDLVECNRRLNIISNQESKPDPDFKLKRITFKYVKTADKYSGCDSDVHFVGDDLIELEIKRCRRSKQSLLA